ncbi:MAG: hypothetical protein JW900_12230 [Anaerolineae bacterium]|nr:hypothetical protein [Anaerolineae bacterium]
MNESMFADSVRDLLVRGIAAAKAGDKDEARRYLEQALAIGPTFEQRAQAFLWLAEVSDDAAEKRAHLEEVLAFDPANAAARRMLAVVEGRLDPDRVVDPNQVAPPEPAKQQRDQSVRARRFVCQQCGGRMAFTPDGRSLTCSYCQRQQSLMEALDDGALVEEQDFTVALATAKGHCQPVATRSFRCHGCGAAFVLPPKLLSSTCPYCDSAYVVEHVETQELVPPEGIIPFAVSPDQAEKALRNWMAAQGLPHRLDGPPTGVYFPVWTFDVGGEIPWQCLERVQDRWVRRSSSKVIFEDDLMVPASRTLPLVVVQEIDGFDRAGIVAYDARYLAYWPAETYEVSVADASLVARRRAMDQAREEILAKIFGVVRDFSLSSTRLIVESFKLVLVPLWVAHYRDEERQYTVAVNGQTAAVRGEVPAKGVKKWLSRLFGGG